MVSLDQFKQTFLTECAELLVEMESRLVDLTPQNADSERLNAIFRCAHSIKGGAGAFGLDYITNFTHVLEALLDLMREGKLAPTYEAVDALLKSVDVVTRMVNAAERNETPDPSLGADVLAVLQGFVGGSHAPATAKAQAAGNAQASSAKRWDILFAAHESLFNSGNEPLLILRELASLGSAEISVISDALPPLAQLDPTQCYLKWRIELITDKSEAAIREVFEFVDSHCDLTLTAQPDAARAVVTPDTKAASDDAAAKANVSTSIRVDLDKVDRLVNMIGELVITEAMIKAQVRDLPTETFAGLLRGVEELSQHTRELQEAVMSVRMQPVKSIFTRMPRIVRDLSTQLGKDIVLETVGENTEVDKTVIEQLGDPLTHMIRNSVDHGIETPEVRIKNGKSARGTIQLSATHQGGRIIIEIRDDGAGVNRPKVLAKAREKGIIAPDAVLTDEECDNLIFKAGFSTADVVSNVSGRGVGMDVVRRNIENLEGTVRVKTEPGKGSVFTVSLPLTLAILDGMIVRVGAENYIIPITSIIETLRPKSDEVHHVDGASDVINVRGEFIPIIYLHEIFRIKNATQDPSKALVVLVESGRDKLGVVVDELIGQQQVVIKSLEANADPVKGISGATILGDGHVSLILEISQLKSLALEVQANQMRAA
jgi:two-component system chemotaxis sensor kinase CheA